jgi:MFS family permease
MTVPGKPIDGQARAEWRASWPLPFVAAFGGTVASIHVYSMGPFFEPLQREFGWGRTDVSVAMTVALGLGGFLNPGMGLALDRIGPRAIGLVGIIVICSAMALLGTATGSALNWQLLWLVVAIGAALVQPMVWVSAVASRFDAARGLAVAITLTGPAIGSSIFPIVSTLLIDGVGWRGAFICLGLLWAVLLLPPMLLFFRGAQDRGTPNLRKSRSIAELPGLTIREGLRSPAFYKLLAAGGLVTFAMIGTIIHLVPIMVEGGETRTTAAGLAALVGIFSVVGRLGTGALLDRYSPRAVAIAAMIPPVSGFLLLLFGDSIWTQVIAVPLIGLSLGVEIDLIAYAATKHFGLKSFGFLYGLLTVSMTVGTAFGPLIASLIFDGTGSYNGFLWLCLGLLTGGGLLLVLLGPYPRFKDLPDVT